MSKSLLFDFDPVSQPAASDPVERHTWCSLRISVGQRVVSRLWDPTLSAERSNLYLPAFPVAEWLVDHWWCLLNELCLWEHPPQPGQRPSNLAVSGRAQSWIRRHCLRSADSSLTLPALYVYHDGRELRVEWHSDAPGTLPNMAGEFIASGVDRLDEVETCQSLTEFVNSVLHAAGPSRDERVESVHQLWNAIQSSTPEEQQFCTLAGRMGLDPYDPNETTDELAEFLERELSNPEDPLVRDFTEIASPSHVSEQWAWVSEIRSEFGMKPSTDTPFAPPASGTSPPLYGYQLARLAREAADQLPNTPLQSVESLAEAALGKGFRVAERNHVPGLNVLAIVGESGSEVISAGPPIARDDNRRFLLARSLYHALVGMQNGARLTSKSYSWDQKASRAFAAELLAPRKALVEHVGDSADSETIDKLSLAFTASARVIERQLENAGIAISCE